MKRYLLFAGDDYYAEGGFIDFMGSFDTIEDALKTPDARYPELQKAVECDWWHIVDITTNRIVKFKDGKYEYRNEIENKKVIFD